MNELKNLKNLLLDVLADEGAENTKINALQTLKIDHKIDVPIIINQHMNISINVRRNIVQAIKIIDQMALPVPEKEKPQIEHIPTVENLPVEISLDFYTEMHKFQYQLIDRALKKTGQIQSKAARLLGMERTTLVAALKRRHCYFEHLTYPKPDCPDCGCGKTRLGPRLKNSSKNGYFTCHVCGGYFNKETLLKPEQEKIELEEAPKSELEKLMGSDAYNARRDKGKQVIGPGIR